MKKIILLSLIVCLIGIGCVKSPGGQGAAVKEPERTQKFVGRFTENVNICRTYGDTIEIQREQEESFDVYKLDINTAKMNYEYTAKSEEDLLFYRQLSDGSALEARRLGNSEEDNVLVLKGESEINIGKEIAYSDGALVSLSPSERYIIYCAAEPIVNRYGLYAYDTESAQTQQLIGTANEELLNDMEWNLSWSPKEDYIIISNNLVLDMAKSAIVLELNASAINWSPSGDKIAYIKQSGGNHKALCIFDLIKGENQEVFVCGQDEYLPGYMVWNSGETKLAMVTADGETSVYKAIYNLDLTTKEAKRIDTLLKLDEATVGQIESMQYNDSGSLLSFACTSSTGANLYVCNLNTLACELFTNVEYLHYENNESYVCSSANRLYFVQGANLMELNENTEAKMIKSSETAIDDIYISKDGTAIIIVESLEACRMVRQIVNFSTPI